MSASRSVAALALCLAAGAAQAAPSLSPVFTSDAAFSAWLAARGVGLPANEGFVAQGRFGDRGGAATYEAGLHIPPSFTSATPVGGGGQVAWGNGGFRSFTLSRTLETIRFQLGGYDRSWTDADADEVNGLGFRVGVNASGVPAGATTILRNLVLDGDAIGVTLTATAGAPQLLVVSGIEGDFVLTGEAAFSWASPTNPGNQQSRLAFQIKGIEGLPVEVPAPAALGLFGLALAGLLAARRRASRD
jgi:hypothetical protein